MTDRWGAALGARMPLGGGTFPMGAATAHLSRYPAYLGLRWRWHAAPFAGAVETSGMAAILRMGQDGFPRATRVEGGLRLSLRRVWAATWLISQVAMELLSPAARRTALSTNASCTARSTSSGTFTAAWTSYWS